MYQPWLLSQTDIFEWQAATYFIHGAPLVIPSMQINCFTAALEATSHEFGVCMMSSFLCSNKIVLASGATCEPSVGLQEIVFGRAALIFMKVGMSGHRFEWRVGGFSESPGRAVWLIISACLMFYANVNCERVEYLIFLVYSLRTSDNIIMYKRHCCFERSSRDHLNVSTQIRSILNTTGKYLTIRVKGDLIMILLAYPRVSK